MKWFVVLFICASLKQQTFGVRRGITCGTFSKNYPDFITDLTPLANTCAKIENQRPSAEQKLIAYIDNVRQTMVSESTRRYALHSIKVSMDTTKTPDERKTIQAADKTAFDKAIKDYDTTVGDATAGTKKDVADLIEKLKPTPVQACSGIIQKAKTTETSYAAILISVPSQMCIDMQGSYKKFTDALNAAYLKINVTPPP